MLTMQDVSIYVYSATHCYVLTLAAGRAVYVIEYGGLIRTAPDLALKASGTSDGMGFDTSVLRQNIGD